MTTCLPVLLRIRPNMLFSTADKLKNIELTVGFESSLTSNARRKELKYRSLVTDLSNDYYSIEFIKPSISYLRIFGESYDSFSKCAKF